MDANDEPRQRRLLRHASAISISQHRLADVAGRDARLCRPGRRLEAAGLDIDADGDYDAVATTLAVRCRRPRRRAADLDAHGHRQRHGGCPRRRRRNTTPSGNIGTIDVGGGPSTSRPIGRMLAHAATSTGVGISGAAPASRDADLNADGHGRRCAPTSARAWRSTPARSPSLPTRPEMKAEATRPGSELRRAGERQLS